MVLVVLSNGRKVNDTLDPVILQNGLVSHPTELEQLRGLNRSRRENDLLTYAGGVCDPVSYVRDSCGRVVAGAVRSGG